jgi:perosamine synthetase
MKLISKTKQLISQIPQIEPCIGREEKHNVLNVLKKKWLTEGVYAKKFVENLKRYTGADYVVLVSNGTLAIWLSLLAAGIKKGDHVIVPDFTFNATASPLSFIGAKPVFVDVDPGTLNIDPRETEAAITSKTKAIIPVHIFGQACNMRAITEIAQTYDLKVIEDAAQAIGTRYWLDGWKQVGTIGDAGIISFYADKTITCGEGACILTNDETIYDKVRMLRNQGRLSSGTFVHDELGMNMRMTDLQCAVGVAQLQKIHKIIKRKKELGCRYAKNLLPLESCFLLSGLALDEDIVPFRFPIRVSNKKKVMQKLEEHGIQTRSFFLPLHQQPCWSHLKYRDDVFLNSIKAYEEGICLPIYPTLKNQQVDYICDVITKVVSE